MNLLSVGAAYGVMTVVAKGGAFGELIGIDHEVPIAPFMPVMMFAILFGLSMDYEVFLISRIREEYLKDGDTRRAVADGLAKTARVITAAAAIMVVVFLAFLAAPDVFLKLFGIGLASAIFLDATVVRMVLVPAVMQLLGHRNWWIPNWLERILPRLDVERVAACGRSRLGDRQRALCACEQHDGGGEHHKGDRADGWCVHDHDRRNPEQHHCRRRRASTAVGDGGGDRRHDPRDSPDADQDVVGDRVIPQRLDRVGGGSTLLRGHIVGVLDQHAGRHAQDRLARTVEQHERDDRQPADARGPARAGP